MFRTEKAKNDCTYGPGWRKKNLTSRLFFIIRFQHYKTYGKNPLQFSTSIVEWMNFCFCFDAKREVNEMNDVGII